MVCNDIHSRLRDVLVERVGLYFDEDKTSVLRKRVGERMRVLGVVDLESYIRMLSTRGRGDDELKELMKLLTVKETYFFRNEPQMEGLARRVLPDILGSRFGTRRIRIWSAGCATGEEPYTVAMLVREHLKDIASWDVEIWGTDINEEALEVAKRGIYGKRAVQKVPEVLLGRYFRSKGGGYGLCPEIREMVRFRYQNLVEESFVSLCSGAGMDLILCRNVLIYFRQDIAGRVLEKLWGCLREDGYLLLGHSEGLYGRQLDLEPVHTDGAFFYQKRESALRRSPAQKTPFEIGSRVVESGNPERQRSEYVSEEASSLLPAQTSDEKAWKTLKEAESYIDAGRFMEASERIRSVLTSDPLSVQGHFLMALLARAEGKTEDAREGFRRVVYLDPSHLLARFYLANVYRKAGQKDQAIRAYRMVQGILAQREQDEAIEGSDGLTVRVLSGLCGDILSSLELEANHGHRRPRR